LCLRKKSIHPPFFLNFLSETAVLAPKQAGNLRPADGRCIAAGLVTSSSPGGVQSLQDPTLTEFQVWPQLMLKFGVRGGGYCRSCSTSCKFSLIQVVLVHPLPPIFMHYMSGILSIFEGMSGYIPAKDVQSLEVKALPPVTSRFYQPRIHKTDTREKAWLSRSNWSPLDYCIGLI
jgi:hypothetical protein